ncbi:MAG TPA: M56 family metallopeptidase [Chitinophagaceae bacterium]|nr:M56 family metallopeptidase [Chitinophagaceae bacterium]
MALLGQSAFLKALGWALLNSIWQMAILWLVYLVLTASLRKLTADIKHSVAILLLGVGFVWFGATLAVQYFDYSKAPAIISAEAAEGTMAGFAGISLQTLEAALPYLSSIYLVIIVFLFFRFFTQYRYTRYVSTHSIQKLAPELRVYAAQIAERMGIKKNVQVWLSEIIDTPMTIGFWKPVILMPIASVNGLSIQQVEAILLHELAHIKRNDYLVNLMIATVDVILFFNPFSRLFIRAIRREREHSCDDLVLQFQYNPHAYASALLVIEQKRMMKVSLAMAATGKNNRMLLDRVKRILNMPVAPRYSNRIIGQLFAGLLLAFIAWSNPGNVIVKNILQPGTETAQTTSEVLIPVFTSDVAPSAARSAKTVKTADSDELLLELVPTDVAFAPAEPEEEDTPGEPTTETDDAASLIHTVALTDLKTYIQYTAPEFIQVAASTLRDYSISEPVTADKPVVALATTVTPFVPSQSFSYYFQDSTKPGTVVISKEEKAARESLQKALKALDEIDWSAVEKQLKVSGEKLDIHKLQLELKKSLEQVDWEKVNAETKLEMLQQEAQKRQDTYLRELTATMKQNRTNMQMQEHYNNLQKKILEDQIKCQQEQMQRQMELKQHLQKKYKPAKKIIHI